MTSELMKNRRTEPTVVITAIEAKLVANVRMKPRRSPLLN